MKDFFKQYLPYYNNYKLKLLFSLIGIILAALGSAGTAYIIKPILDDIFVNKDVQMLYILPFIVIALYAAKGIGRYIQVYYISYIGQDIIKILRNRLLEHILTLDIRFFYQHHTGELISRLTNDINRIQNAVSNQIAEFLRESITVIALMGIVIFQSPQLAFYGLVVLPLALLPLSILAKKMKKLSFKSQEKISDITTNLSEIFSNIEIIKANNTQKLEQNHFKHHNQTFFDITMKSIKTNELVSPVMELLGAIAVAVVIIIGGQQVINGELSIGSFFSFMTALFMLYTPIKRISSLYNSMQDALAANERINGLFNLRPTIKDGDLPLPTPIHSIEFHNVNLYYENLQALKHIDLTIKKGEPLALVGESGGGKSSLVNLLLRFYDPSSGTIKLNDHDITTIKLQELRNNISIVTQRIYIFNDTIAANVAYGKKINESTVIKALKQANAYNFVQTLPQGIYTKLEESGTNLSGGQRQRIAIARALYKNPSIIIFDEATSALDNQSESSITECIQAIHRDRIIIIIAHRLSTIKHTAHIALFKKGEIVAYNTHEQLLKTCNDYKALYGKF